MIDSLGVHLPFLIIQLINLFLLCGWPLLSLATVFTLRKSRLHGLTLAVWVLIVLVIPYLGALAYFIIRPAQDHPNA